MKSRSRHNSTKKSFMIFFTMTLRPFIKYHSPPIKSLFSPVAELINMPWLIHEQQKGPNFLKNKPISKSFDYFWNVCKELLAKKLNIRSNLWEVFLKNTVSESPSACNFVQERTPAQLYSYEFIEFSGWLLLSLSIAIICQQHFKQNVRIMRATIF